MITNETELGTAVEKASGLIQQISDYLAVHPSTEAKGRIRFPRGFIRSASQHRMRLQFVDDRVLRSNISYALMTHDVLRWIVFRTDISIQARDMVIKESLCVIASVCESLTVHKGCSGLGRKKSYSDRISKLLADGIISTDVHADLEWLWGKRRQVHLMDVDFKEHGHYVTADWIRSVKTYHGLRGALEQWLT